MLHIKDTECDVVSRREGIRTRMYIWKETGATNLTVFEQWFDPGHGPAIHTHEVEEVLRVLSGEARIQVGSEVAIVGPGESVIVPAGKAHGFINAGNEELHMLCIVAAPILEGYFIDSGTSFTWSGEPNP